MGISAKVRLMSRQKGFTLIELMVVVAIVGILAAVAYPSYQGSIRKTNRSDAKDALLRLAAAQERFFFSNNGYTNDLSKLGFTAQSGNFFSTENHYQLTVTAGPTCTSAGGKSFPCYTVTATARGGQAADEACTTFTVDQTGRKAAAKKDNTVNTDNCW